MSDLCHQVNTLAKLDDILKVGFCHQASSLVKSNNILKIVVCHLVSILTITNDEADDITSERLVIFNQLLTPCRWVIIKDKNFIP